MNPATTIQCITVKRIGWKEAQDVRALDDADLGMKLAGAKKLVVYESNDTSRTRQYAHDFSKTTQWLMLALVAPVVAVTPDASLLTTPKIAILIEPTRKTDSKASKLCVT
jgi:hypothetical protein